MTARNNEDLLNPHRFFYRMIKDYIDGKLTDKSFFFRAIVVEVDTSSEGGLLETSPSNPPNSVKARIYTKGLDANLPEAALSVFYPFFPSNISVPISPGEHVFVFFEDNNYSNGFWITHIPNYSLNPNDYNPDHRSNAPAPTSADHFEGTTTTSTPIPADERQVGGGSPQNDRRNDRNQNLLEQNAAKFQNKKILNIGDSHTAGAYGNALGREINRMGGTYIPDGRSSWSVENWVAGEFSGHAQTERRSGPTLNNLIAQHNPDIVIVSLGANDWFRASGSTFHVAAVALWEIAQTAPKSIWVGPPQTVGRAVGQTSGLAQVNSALTNVVGAANYVVSTDVTNITEERDVLGIHFRQTPRAFELIRPWIDKVIAAL